MPRSARAGTPVLHIFCDACGTGFRGNVLSCSDLWAPARRVNTPRMRGDCAEATRHLIE
jgi:hypothetical protein